MEDQNKEPKAEMSRLRLNAKSSTQILLKLVTEPPGLNHNKEIIADINFYAKSSSYSATFQSISTPSIGSVCPEWWGERVHQSEIFPISGRLFFKKFAAELEINPINSSCGKTGKGEGHRNLKILY